MWIDYLLALRRLHTPNNWVTSNPETQHLPVSSN